MTNQMTESEIADFMDPHQKMVNQMIAVIKHVRYKDAIFYIGLDDTRPYLQVKFYGECAIKKSMEMQHGRKWFLSPYMTDSELVATAFKAALTAEEHEVRENFRYKGFAVYSPHYDVEKLVELQETGNAFEVRG